MLRVAAYCRVSTSQEDQRNSLENQRRYFSEYISRQPDWELVEVYADEGLSGTSSDRPAFRRMLAAAAEEKIDLILTKEVSRFARNTVDTLAYTRLLRRQGVGIVFIGDHIDTRQNDGEFRLTIMASVAQEESRKISERVKWGQQRSMERGVVFGCN
ncbi:MAG: recombinase family protein, partial [Eubacteriales bacterium]|nr:recombinase family protein [Eubacteriales bacterium]